MTQASRARTSQSSPLSPPPALADLFAEGGEGNLVGEAHRGRAGFQVRIVAMHFLWWWWRVEADVDLDEDAWVGSAGGESSSICHTTQEAEAEFSLVPPPSTLHLHRIR